VQQSGYLNTYTYYYIYDVKWISQANLTPSLFIEVPVPSH